MSSTFIRQQRADQIFNRAAVGMTATIVQFLEGFQCVGIGYFTVFRRCDTLQICNNVKQLAFRYLIQQSSC